MIPAPRSTGDRVAAAREAILALVEREHAVVGPEVEAVLCEQSPPGPTTPDPMVVRLALEGLLASGAVSRHRSGPSVFVSPHPADPAHVDEVAVHKAAMLARYRAWEAGPESDLRVAAERVVHASFKAAAAAGYRVGDPPLDAAVLVPRSPDGTSGDPILLPLTVQVSRDWLMPHSRAPYRLLLMASQILATEGEAAVLPILVCRRTDAAFAAMGRDLGFYVMDTRREFLLPGVAETAVLEVRSTLHLTDLTRSDTYDRLLVSRLENLLPTLAGPLVERWRRATATDIPLHFAELAAEPSASARRRQVSAIRAIAEQHGLVSAAGAW